MSTVNDCRALMNCFPGKGPHDPERMEEWQGLYDVCFQTFCDLDHPLYYQITVYSVVNSLLFSS